MKNRASEKLNKASSHKWRTIKKNITFLFIVERQKCIKCGKVRSIRDNGFERKVISEGKPGSGK